MGSTSNLQQLGERDWVSIGNSADEARKISGDPSHVVWHIHGCVGMPPERSKLVLTDKDYDELYLDASPMVDQLKALLSQRRVVFIGFGFKDFEVARLLRVIGRLGNPARPAFLFFADKGDAEAETERRQLLDRYNVDSIAYRAEHDTHEKLPELLRTYDSFVLRRNLRFGQPNRPCPSYDPETTGLLLYNAFVLGPGSQFNGDIIGALLRTRILSLLRHYGRATVKTLVNDVAERVAAIQKRPPLANTIEQQITQALMELQTAKRVALATNANGLPEATLTSEGNELVAAQAATAELLSQQFTASLRSRAHEIVPDSPEVAGRVAEAAETFLKDCITRRALGVAMLLFTADTQYHEYHMVALLQALHEFMTQLPSADEARILIRLVLAILGAPDDAERRYMGLLLQAHFGIHLLGYRPETLKARADEAARTLFLLDSTTLIPLIARSSAGHNSACFLLDKLRSLNATVVTTTLLVEEAVEHANWPLLAGVVSEQGMITLETAKAAKGHAGYRSNSFLDGFLAEASDGRIAANYHAYLDAICGVSIGKTALNDAFEGVINSEMLLIKFGDWDDFESEEFAERDEIKDKIAERRRANGTYRHDRQVVAEAEAFLLIRDVRSGKMKITGRDLASAFFVSRTRIIDDVVRVGLPVTMREESILQWLSTLSPCTVDELAYLVDALLWELSERNLSVINQQRLQTVFSPLIAASKEQRREELEKHKSLIAGRYGEDAIRAFSDAGDLDLPVVMGSYFAQKAEELEKRVSEEQARRQAAEQVATLRLNERNELEKFRAKKKQKQLEMQKRKRAKSSKHGKKRKHS